jgi:hypothetical protein
MEMPRPTEAHRRLHALAGTWSGGEKMHPSPWDPQGGAAEGRVENRVALDGFALVQHYEQRRGGRTSFTGHGVFSWDAAAGRHQMHWWDSMGSPVNVFTGAMVGDRLVLECPQGAGASRATFDLAHAAHGRYSFLMEVSPDGAQWFPFMEGNYRRA